VKTWDAEFASAAQPATAAPSLNEAVVDGKIMHPSLLNRNVRETQYAVRGELYLKAEELRQKGMEIIFTNVGNPHALGQVPITYNRQVLALCAAPFLLEHPEVTKMFPSDAISRAKELLSYNKGGIGAYSDSRGAEGVRKEVARYIEQRDGMPAGTVNHNNIFLTDGASVAVRMGLNSLIRDENDGILVPIPQYPLYSASIKLYGGSLVPYELDESKGWGLNVEALRKACSDAKAKGILPRGLVFINPGNPTGQCLSKENLKELAQFASEEQVVLMADEVYQENIFQDERPFVSMRQVLYEAGEPLNSKVELLSFHTVSKGALGECGLRGGYVEMHNIHPGAIEEVYKTASINLSPNVLGQMAMGLMVNPPAPGTPSYEGYMKEKNEVLASMRRRAHIMTDAFNSLEGVTCNFTEGAMYSFPQLHLPKKAIEAAKAAGKSPDVFYCLKLLEATGISVVPGSGFGQAEGTFHLRTTILPMEDVMKEKFVPLLTDFHKKFMDTYRD